MKTRIKELAEKAGITTAYQLQKAANLSASMAARLYRDEVEMIALTTINALCEALNCQPGDLFDNKADLALVADRKPGRPKNEPVEAEPVVKTKKKTTKKQ